MSANTDINKKILHLRRLEFLDHLRRVGLIYLLLAIGFFVILCKYITVGETSYINAVVDEYASLPTAVGGTQYLIMRNSDGETVSVEIAGLPKVGDELVLSARKRLLFYGPQYRIDTSRSVQ